MKFKRKGDLERMQISFQFTSLAFFRLLADTANTIVITGIGSRLCLSSVVVAVVRFLLVRNFHLAVNSSFSTESPKLLPSLSLSESLLEN